MLLFVIRDKSKTPLSKLVEVLSEDVHKMWDTISKPPQYVDSKIDDFFEVGGWVGGDQVLKPAAATAALGTCWQLQSAELVSGRQLQVMGACVVSCCLRAVCLVGTQVETATR